MATRYRKFIGLGVAAGVCLFSGTALADGGGTCNFQVQGMGLTSVSTSQGTTTLDVSITVLDTGNVQGSWAFPDPSDSNINQNPQALPELSITDTTTNQSYTATASSLLNQPAALTAGKSGTALYAFQASLPNPGDNYNITLIDHTSDHVFHMYGLTSDGTYNYNNTSPVCNDPPVPPISGQLPEVPFAIGLPLAGAGAAWLGWRRKKLLQSPVGP
ncbi:MAG: hypothetical protein K6U87_01100 [Firmicutes bacterium]|nr:hypothetical protein [Bacillota bacterium]